MTVLFRLGKHDSGEVKIQRGSHNSFQIFSAAA